MEAETIRVGMTDGATPAQQEKMDRLRRGLGMGTSAPAVTPDPGEEGPALAPSEPQDEPEPEEGPVGLPAPERPRTGHPDWFVMPPGGVPGVRPGTAVAYVRMHAHLTGDPSKGHRQCMLALLRVKDQDAALARLRGMDPSGMRTMREMAKQTVRVVDGKLVDWGRPKSVHDFWEEIGPGYQQRIQEWYARTHTFSREDKADFFANCIDDRVAG